MVFKHFDKELDLCSRVCRLVVFQLNATTLFSTATSRCPTLSYWSDRSCTPQSSYLERRCLILAVLLGEDADLGRDRSMIISWMR